MHLDSFARTLTYSLGLFTVFTLFAFSRQNTSTSAATAQGNTKMKKSCEQYLTHDGPHGDAFTNVRPWAPAASSPASYRDYSCVFESGAPVTGTITGTFKVEATDTGGGQVNTGAGWVMMNLRFTTSDIGASEYDECNGNFIVDFTQCAGAHDAPDFSVPASGQWTGHGNNSVKGFADATGKATLRIDVSRVEHVTSQPFVQHLVSAEGGSRVTITAD